VTLNNTAKNQHINQNDYLGKLSFMDATTQNIAKDYTVTPAFLDGRSVTAVPAVYNSTTDRLELQAPETQ